MCLDNFGRPSIEILCAEFECSQAGVARREGGIGNLDPGAIAGSYHRIEFDRFGTPVYQLVDVINIKIYPDFAPVPIGLGTIQVLGHLAESGRAEREHKCTHEGRQNVHVRAPQSSELGIAGYASKICLLVSAKAYTIKSSNTRLSLSANFRFKLTLQFSELIHPGESCNDGFLNSLKELTIRMRFGIGLIGGLAGVAILSLAACSEKQKAASRLESQMRQEMAQESAATVQSDLVLDSLSADKATDTPLSFGDSVTTPGSNQIAAGDDGIQTKVDSPVAGHGEPLADSAGDSSAVAAEPESATPPDAGAIPDEGKIRSGSGSESEAPSEYVVQIASSPDRSYAEQTVSSYAARGYQTHMTSAEVNGVTYYRVRIGRFSSSDSAARARDDLAQKFGVSGFVTRVR